ncbi:hypothetical protein R6138_01881 [Ralstonia thomasii]|nr:hypothetical protein R6138_01881 [Ralstonia sp. LMG 18095]
MGLISDNTAASGVQAGAAVGTAAYSMTNLPWSTIAAVISVVVSLVYLWGALPRWCKTTAAFCRGVFHRDWSEWKKLGDQPMQGDE